MSISKACNGMYAKFNLSYRQFDTCLPNALYKLFNSYVCHCMEVSYGIIKIDKWRILYIWLGENVSDVCI